jgi:hypothetical protein
MRDPDPFEMVLDTVHSVRLARTMGGSGAESVAMCDRLAGMLRTAGENTDNRFMRDVADAIERAYGSKQRPGS